MIRLLAGFSLVSFNTALSMLRTFSGNIIQDVVFSLKFKVFAGQNKLIKNDNGCTLSTSPSLVKLQNVSVISLIQVWIFMVFLSFEITFKNCGPENHESLLKQHYLCILKCQRLVFNDTYQS